PAEPTEDVGAPGLITADDNLGVGTAAECVALRLELAPQFEKIIDFAVVTDPNASVGAAHGLVRGSRQVDDGKPRVREAAHAVVPDAFVVRTAMPHRADHAPQPALGVERRRPLADPQKAGDAAHSAAPTPFPTPSAANPKFAPQLPRVRLRTSGSKRH